MSRTSVLLLSLICSCGSFILSAEETVPFRFDQPFEELFLPLEKQYIFCDSSNAMSFSDVRQQAFSQVTTEVTREAGLTYWIKYKLENRTGRPLHLVLFPGRAELAQLYHPSLADSSYDIRSNGRLVPFSGKDIQGFINYANQVRVDIPSDTTLLFYTKTYNERNFFVDRKVVAQLVSRDLAFEVQYFDNLIAAFFVGGMLVMALYTAILSVTIRDSIYYFYVGFILSGMMFYVYFYGFTIEWVWPELPTWDIYSFIYIISGTFIFWLLFTRSYLQVGRTLPFWDKVIMALITLNFLPCVIVIPEFFGWTGPNFLATLQVWQNGLILLTLILIIVIAYVGYRTNVESARFFLLGNLAVLLGSILLSLRFMGLMPNNAWINNAGQFGFFLQLILFSVGLGDRINRMRETIVLKDVAKMKLERSEELKRRELIEQKNRELEEKVKERTAEVQRQKQEVEDQAIQLRDQNEQLTKVNAYKDRLFSIIGHDLRNPIGTLNGVLDLLNKGKIELEDVQLIGRDLQKSLHSVMEMLDNLLMWALQQLDEVQVHAVQFKPLDLIEENIHLMKPQADQKGITLSVGDVDAGALAHADQEMIKLVIRNLVSNSLKFTERGGKVWFSLAKRDDRILLGVHDDGLGMSQEFVQSLFTRQPDISYGTENEKGTGLGLRLCHEFVQRNQGEVTVSSEEGKGSTFMISLPTV